MIHRRGLITGFISLIAAPAIVRASSLMPVKALIIPEGPVGPLGPGGPVGYRIGDWVRVELPAGLSRGPYRITNVSNASRSISIGRETIYLA
jgi:hypothetical protein